jgi:Transposase DDE domain
VFEAVVKACMDAGLVKGEGFAVDASVIEADASRYHGKAPGEIDWSAPERQTRAVAEFLTALDDEGADADRKPPKVISPVDPCSAWTAKANKRVQLGYGLNYLIDIKYAVIVDVEATPARTYDEMAATKTIIKRTEERLGLKPERLAADTAYGTGKFLHWVIGTGITPHIPVWDMNNEIERTRYGLVGGVTEQTPRAGVPEVDDALAISSDDCVGAHGQNGLSDCMRNVHDSASRMIVRPHRIPNSLIEGSSA